MRNIFFEHSLKFEIDVIGYKNKGESIVFFLITDEKVSYAGLVDSYEEDGENEAVKLLLKTGRQYFDFVCWTHPHDDHTIGMDRILEQYCNQDTAFWMFPFYSKNTDGYSQMVRHTYKNLFSIIESPKRKKMKIRTAINANRMERCICSCIAGAGRYNFEVFSFAPSSEILTANMVRGQEERGNLYSVGLLINIGAYCIMLAGDVENRTFQVLPDYDLEFPIDYIKIPHHGSSSSEILLDRLAGLGIEAPNVAVSTVFRRHHLPEQAVLKKYSSWGKKTELYCSGNPENMGSAYKSGIIQTTFDVLQKCDFPIETSLYGGAVKVELWKKV